MGKYRYNTFMEYLPKRYSATAQQERDRKEIYQFKDGNCSQRIQDGVIDMINSLNITNKSNWHVCFISNIQGIYHINYSILYTL